MNIGRILPFCDGCQYEDWDGGHHWPCTCLCHMQPMKTRPLAERAADWRKARHE